MIPPIVLANNFTLSGILSSTIDNIKRNPLVCMGLPLAALVPPLAVFALFERQNSSQPTLAAFLVTCISMLLLLAAQGAVTYGVYANMQNQPCSLQAALTKGMSRLLPLFLTIFMINLIAKIFASLLSDVFMPMGTSIPSMIILVGVSIIPLILINCMLAVAIPACIMEVLGPISSFKRSVQLTQGFRGKIFLLQLFIGIFQSIGLVIVLYLPNSSLPTLLTILLCLIASLPGAFNMVMLVTMYYTLRATKEGVSMKSLARIFDE